NDLVKDQIRIFEKTRKDVRIKENYEKAGWSVKADSLQIKQVIMNLLVNSFQAMPNGGELHIVTQNVDIDKNPLQHLHAKPGQYVKLIIADTGVGMDRATMQRVFEPFFTTKKMGPHKGTGLGLASAYGIIKDHNGFITVKSVEGKGSSFNVYLPRSAKYAEAENIVTRRDDTKIETVLTVDQEDGVRGVLEQMLKKLGFKVLQARDGRQALETVHRAGDKVDLVIIDGDLPDNVNHELLLELKKVNPLLKVMILSHRGTDECRNTITKLAANGFLKKPFNMMQLTTQMTEMSGQ
ncbi:MAG: ATP-binding protein, partial [Desulfobacterales bacterium]